MKRGQAPVSANPKRSRTDAISTAAESQALVTNNVSGLVNRGLDALPEKNLLQAGQVLATSAATTQASSINAAIANTAGLTAKIGITNAAVLPDLLRGAIGPDLATLNASQLKSEKQREFQRNLLLSKLHQSGELGSGEAYRKLMDTPIETLEEMVAKVTGQEEEMEAKDDSLDPKVLAEHAEAKHEEENPPDGQKMGQTKKIAPVIGPPVNKDAQPAQLLAAGGNVRGELGNPNWTSVPISQTFSDRKFRKWEADHTSGVTQNPTVSGGTDNPYNSSNPEYRGKGVFEHELWPYLPEGNAEDIKDNDDDRHLKAINVSLFDSVLRDPMTGDVNLNPLQMNTAITDAWRYMSDNHVMDPVFPGGELNIGALPVTTMRAMPPENIIRDEHARVTSARNKKRGYASRDAYQDTRMLAAAASMASQQKDVRWINNNNSVRDFQYTAHSNNTMPIEPDWWNHRRQDDGVVPLQDNLLPANALWKGVSIGFAREDQNTSELYDTRTRHDPTWNPAGKMGWLGGVPFA